MKSLVLLVASLVIETGIELSLDQPSKISTRTIKPGGSYSIVPVRPGWSGAATSAANSYKPVFVRTSSGKYIRVRLGTCMNCGGACNAGRQVCLDCVPDSYAMFDSLR